MPPSLTLNTLLLKPGMRLAVGLSGGADSVALLCALTERSRKLGLVLHAAHLHHGLRGAEADADLEFSRELAVKFGLPFHEAHVDTAAEARRPITSLDDDPATDSIEATARRLRYRWFRELLSSGDIDAVATAHTLDDQAETVLAKFLRGAWTEGLSGIHPALEFPEGPILRPFLHTTRAEIEVYLNDRNQPWREDSTNRHLTFTRNRIRHELLPQLESWNPQLRDHLAQMADLAREEEIWWDGVINRLASEVILRGRPVRGGGRAATSSEGIALDIARLLAEPVPVQRRLVRHIAGELEASLDFSGTESLRNLALSGRAGQKVELAGGLRAERTHRELRMTRGPATVPIQLDRKAEQYECVIPGEIESAAYGCRIRIGVKAQTPAHAEASGGPIRAILRPWKSGDRVHLRYSSGPRKVKEVLERMKVTGTERAGWPVLDVGGQVLWMRGVEVEQDPRIQVLIEPLSPHLIP
jgi:tRNA(Ile)-lysidine synthase